MPSEPSFDTVQLLDYLDRLGGVREELSTESIWIAEGVWERRC
jgi:hypothetical protein